MTKPAKNEEELPVEAVETPVEEPKVVIPKPPIPGRNPPAFFGGNQFRGGKGGGNVFAKQRPGRAAARGR